MRGVRSKLTTAAAALVLVATATGCGASGVRMFPLEDPMWRDLDAHPFTAEPEEYYSGLLWDGADQMLFRPFAKFWAVRQGSEAANVNAWDEVPDSAWFRNRHGKVRLSRQELIDGPCRRPPLDPSKKWTATRAKPNGANPGFIIKGNDGKGYLLKFDGTTQGVRPTAADTIVSKFYHAAGYNAPCNRIVKFNRDTIEIAPDATSVDSTGKKVKMTQADIDKVLKKAVRLPDGRYRGSSSLFLDGKPIGPFRYEETREDDPNDVIPHEERRELRGHYVLAAWTGHTDAREQNTLDTFVETQKGQGFIRHHIIDFGDCFGSAFEPPNLGRRLQHTWYFNGADVFSDWVTLGIVPRPWDRLRFGRSGPVWAYFDIEEFSPDEWTPAYGNPAMSRKTERDAAWMARILARFTPDDIRAMLRAGQIGDQALEDELFRLLMGRRQKLLGRWLTRLSPLAWPTVAGDELCVDDLAVYADIIPVDLRRYRAKAWAGGTDARTLRELSLADEPAARPGAEVCLTLPRQARTSRETPGYLIVDVTAGGGSASRWPLRLHLYDLGGEFKVVGIERPDRDAPPDA